MIVRRSRTAALGQSSLKKSMERQCYLLLALPLIGFFVFTIYPIVWAMLKAFFYYDKNPINTRFTGIENFINVFAQDKSYWIAWLTTFKFMLLKLPFEVPMALILAVVLKGVSNRSGMVFRAIFTMPNIVSAAIIGVIFTNMFDYFGCINAFLEKIGVLSEPMDWFGSANGALAALCAGSIWNCIGVNILYFTAALANVPDEVYEAAKIDGANVFTTFFRITIPMIAPVFQTILLLAINGTMQCGEYIVAFTNGAPGGATNTVGSYMIKSFLPGFASGAPNVGYGCAMAIITSCLSALVAGVYMKLSKKMKEVY